MKDVCEGCACASCTQSENCNQCYCDECCDKETWETDGSEYKSSCESYRDH